jgi:hypothetical protein
LAPFGIVLFEQLVAQDQVRFVLDRQRGRVVAGKLPGAVKKLAAVLLLAVP